MDEEYLKKITVKIIANDDVIGAGIIIDNKHVLTCNHVVEYYSTVNIKFLDDNKVINASVIDRDEIKDYAILELEEEVSNDKIAKLGTKYSNGNEFHSVGFALQNKLEYINATGKIVDETRKDGIKVLQLDSKNISGGMSGAPVYNVNTRRVIGIISEHFKTNNFEHRDLSLAIPIDIIDNNIVKQNVERYKIDDKLRRFLEKQKEYFARESKIDHKRLKDYYVPNDLVKADTATWNKDELSDNDIIDSNWSINKFLESDEPITVIGSEFGIGKSSYAKYIAYNLAESRLEGKNGYIPIFINLATEDINYNLELILSELPKGASYKILLILDGLDEYNGKVEELIEKLISYKVNYKERGIDLKVLITTRMINAYPDILKTKQIYEYIRIKPFNEEQVNEFFNRYGADLTYEYLKDTFGLSDNEILKPLFAWMIAYMHKESDGLRKIDVSKLKDDSVKYRIVRTILYHNFITALIRGKHRDEVPDKLKASYNAEKEALRVLSAINNIYDKIEGDINKLVKSFNINYNNIDKALEYIIVSYLYTSIQNPYNPTKVYKFIHKSIQEYLLAEYLYENIKNNNIHKLAIGLPSKECMDFLHGLIDILKYYDGIKYMLDYPEGAERLVNGDEVNGDDTNRIINNCKSIIKDDKIILRDIENKDGFTVSKDNNANRYSKLYIHRWIAVNILSWLSDEEDRKLADVNIKEHLSSLIRETSYNIENYLKYLEYLNLSGAKLFRANLSRAKLFRANLSRANLCEADLYGANLSRAKLFRANLSRANLSEADLYGADLSYAYLSRANLSRANLSEANLSEADLSEADLSEAKLSGADLSEAKLFGADLSGAKLSYAYLSKANLSGANLSGANLFGAYFFGAYLSEANLFGANLSEANLSRANLSEADLSYAYLFGANLFGANLSRANLSEANLSEAKLSEADLSEAKLSEADLSEAKLSEADLSEAKLSEAKLSYVIFYLFSWEDEDIHNSNLANYLKLYGINIQECKLTRNNNKITLTRDNSEIIIELKDNNAILTIHNKKLKLDVIKEDNKTKIFIPIIVNEDTNTKGIILTHSNDKESIKKALSNLHPNIREIVLRDNPNYKEIWK